MTKVKRGHKAVKQQAAASSLAQSKGGGQDVQQFYGLDSAQSNFTVKSVNKERLDAFISAQLPTVSRSKVTQSIKEGKVLINGAVATKPASKVKAGDHVQFTPPEPPAVHVAAEPMDLNILHEDAHVVVLNKAAHVVVHPAPGRRTGTLVNGLLHHFGVPGLEPDADGKLPVSFQQWLDQEDVEGGEGPGKLTPGGGESAAAEGGLSGARGESTAAEVGREAEGERGRGQGPDEAGMVEAEMEGGVPIVRPGIVHRLDKGTTGILVVGKTNTAHARLAAQFAAKTARREYWALLTGWPAQQEGTVRTNLVRSGAEDGTFSTAPYGGPSGKTAVSHYKVLRRLGDGAASVVAWRLETGRTHQIRVHARHLGHPLLGDTAYSGTAKSLATALAASFRSRRASAEVSSADVSTSTVPWSDHTLRGLAAGRRKAGDVSLAADGSVWCDETAVAVRAAGGARQSAVSGESEGWQVARGVQHVRQDAGGGSGEAGQCGSGPPNRGVRQRRARRGGGAGLQHQDSGRSWQEVGASTWVDEGRVQGGNEAEVGSAPLAGQGVSEAEQYQEVKVAVLAAVEKLARPALHARFLGFEHPASGEQVDFLAGMPADMQTVVDAFQWRRPPAEG